jgi:hypothetical protein
LPDWLTFNGTTRTFSGVPANTAAISYHLIVKANDGALTESAPFTLTVTQVNKTRLYLPVIKN